MWKRLHHMIRRWRNILRTQENRKRPRIGCRLPGWGRKSIRGLVITGSLSIRKVMCACPLCCRGKRISWDRLRKKTVFLISVGEDCYSVYGICRNRCRRFRGRLRHRLCIRRRFRVRLHLPLRFHQSFRGRIHRREPVLPYRRLLCRRKMLWRNSRWGNLWRQTGKIVFTEVLLWYRFQNITARDRYFIRKRYPMDSQGKM